MCPTRRGNNKGERRRQFNDGTSEPHLRCVVRYLKRRKFLSSFGRRLRNSREIWGRAREYIFDESRNSFVLLLLVFFPRRRRSVLLQMNAKALRKKGTALAILFDVPYIPIAVYRPLKKYLLFDQKGDEEDGHKEFSAERK